MDNGSDDVTSGTKTSGKRDVFPTTQRTWMGDRLESGEPPTPEVLRHVMAVYAEPLTVYLRGCSLRWLGDAEDLVNGFFADRLSRPEYLGRWLSSGRPLRYWLIVGFKHYLLEELRRKRRDANIVHAEQELSVDSESDNAYKREFVVSVVRDALVQTSNLCEERGLEQHWSIFHRHDVNGESYESIEADTGIGARRLAVMRRTVATQFKRVLRERLGWHGASIADVDAEIISLVEQTNR